MVFKKSIEMCYKLKKINKKIKTKIDLNKVNLENINNYLNSKKISSDDFAKVLLKLSNNSNSTIHSPI